MKGYTQARWPEPLIFELGRSGRSGVTLPKAEEAVKAIGDWRSLAPKNMLRAEPPDLPEVTEVEVVRHYVRLSQMSYGVDLGFYPLGSCTMKYNPKVCEALANLDQVHWIHPYQEEETVQGALELMYKLSSWLAEITGTDAVSLQPAAGAHGEFVGTLIMRAYHKLRGETRIEIIVPDSAHGTNPASAAMAGFKVVVVPTRGDGCIDMEALKSVLSNRTAGLMLTNPNTLGVFEKDIVEIAKMVHEQGGLLYYDGANLNAILGKARPGDMGFDIVHINLHKTFSTPHGGGGPGAGPIGVKKHLEEFLPVPLVRYDGKKYYLDYDLPHSIGKVRAFYGNFEVLVRAFAYILSMGAEGLRKASEVAVLNANYLARKVSRIEGLTVPYGGLVKHEFVASASKLKSATGVETKHVAKRLLDYGVHAPTVYFPLIVGEALMIEPTETEALEEIDRFAEALSSIVNEAREKREAVLNAPHSTSVGLLDEVKASHPKTLSLSWRMMRKRLKTLRG
ncbi:MAG: aminomethyl-transferring glycine dehydrogenase subunit GcvPB [Candidatus Nezhaarchaeales archaeon]